MHKTWALQYVWTCFDPGAASVLFVHFCVLFSTACMAIRATPHILESSSHSRTPCLHIIAKYVYRNSIQASDFQPFTCMDQSRMFFVTFHNCHPPQRIYICLWIPLTLFWVCGCAPCLHQRICIHVIIHASCYHVCVLVFVHSGLALPRCCILFFS